MVAPATGRDRMRGMRLGILCPLLLAATSLLGQSAEYASASGGAINVMPKATNPFSGSLSLTLGNGPGYGATFGGAIVPDKMWFFASAERVQPLVTTSVTRAFDVKAMTQLSDRQNLAASFVSANPQTPFNTTIPTKFLSLHYTSMLSDNMFMTASVSKESR